MKIKILLFPLIILVIFYLAVAHIFPDWQRSQEVKTEIEGNELVMENIQKQQSNVEKLSAQITSDVQQKENLVEIVPLIRAEETIIDAAHQLAQKYQVALLQMTFDQQKQVAKRGSDPLAQVPTYTTPGSTQISVSISGPYNNTKEFLDNFKKIMRANTPAALAMSRIENTGENGEAAGLEDQLDTEAMYNYPFLEEVILQESDMKTLQHGVQSQEQFNMTPIDEWIAMTNEDVTDLQLKEHGRGSSPFMP